MLLLTGEIRNKILFLYFTTKIHSPDKIKLISMSGTRDSDLPSD